MEAEIGVPLLHRHARGVTMTEAGEVLARMPARFLRSSSVCASDARLRLRSAGTLRLFANTSAMSAFLPGSLPHG